MMILALEKELKRVDWENETLTLIEEAKSAYELVLAGVVREIYFTENKNAVLILECENGTTAKKRLTELPLVKKGMVDFEILELHPYTGFSRLMDLK